MKVYGVVGMALGLDGDGGTIHDPASFTARREGLLGDWVGSRTVMYVTVVSAWDGPQALRMHNLYRVVTNDTTVTNKPPL
jgi:hypothetical protein